MTEAEILALLEQVGSEMLQLFTKQYSVARMDQLNSHLSTCKMIVSEAHDEATREEDQGRKDGVVQRMVLAGRTLTDAQAAVERGER